jgi:hypothetical protein
LLAATIGAFGLASCLSADEAPTSGKMAAPQEAAQPRAATPAGSAYWGDEQDDDGDGWAEARPEGELADPLAAEAPTAPALGMAKDNAPAPDPEPVMPAIGQKLPYSAFGAPLDGLDGRVAAPTGGPRLEPMEDRARDVAKPAKQQGLAKSLDRIEKKERAATKNELVRGPRPTAPSRRDRASRTVALVELAIEGEEEEAPRVTGAEAMGGRSRDKGGAVTRGGRDDAFALDQGLLADEDEDWRRTPARWHLPRVGYFENTYLGGNAAYLERLRRLDDGFGGQRPYADLTLAPQPFDAPEDGGVALTTAVDVSHVDEPGRVFLQIGLQGSARYGWRRPPLDVVLVVADNAGGVDAVEPVVLALIRRLGAQDRLGLVRAGGEILAEPAPVRDVRRTLARTLAGLSTSQGRPGGLAAGMDRAGTMLARVQRDPARVPGTGIVLALVGEGGAHEVQPARAAAHRLSLGAVVTTVLQIGEGGSWWAVANAGHGNYRTLPRSPTPESAGRAVADELSAISRVVARLLRVNVRLAPGVHAIRIPGSRMLGATETKRVKAREAATDRQLSLTMGVQADRGEDDDGLQTVIPYFYGGESHVILLELWVERPGPIADVTLRYKDMVALDNARAQTSVALGATPRPLTPAHLAVRANARGFEIAAAMDRAAHALRTAGPGAARQALVDARPHASTAADRRALATFQGLLGDAAWSRVPARRGLLAEALEMGGSRRVGAPAR